jgi:SAM-dependent methyltransferase
MSLRRSVEPEILDEMPADDRRAIQARQGLKRLNAFMLQTGIMAPILARQWPQESAPPRTILDLGAGDGTFSLSVARRLAARWRGVTVILLDRQNIVAQATRDAFAALGWKAETVTADVLDHLAQIKSTDVITANLFLHHFRDEQLARLLGLAAQSTRLFVACEPRRNKFSLRASRLSWALGCNEVALHDAIVSARAGLAGQELTALWPSDEPSQDPSQGQWIVQEYEARLFTHCFVARRR